MNPKMLAAISKYTKLVSSIVLVKREKKQSYEFYSFDLFYSTELVLTLSNALSYYNIRSRNIYYTINTYNFYLRYLLISL